MRASLALARGLIVVVVLGIVSAVLPIGVGTAYADPPTIAGVVVNESNARLPNVTVAVLNNGASTTTNGNGEFLTTTELETEPDRGQSLPRT